MCWRIQFLHQIKWVFSFLSLGKLIFPFIFGWIAFNPNKEKHIIKWCLVAKKYFLYFMKINWMKNKIRNWRSTKTVMKFNMLVCDVKHTTTNQRTDWLEACYVCGCGFLLVCVCVWLSECRKECVNVIWWWWAFV